MKEWNMLNECNDFQSSYKGNLFESHNFFIEKKIMVTLFRIDNDWIRKKIMCNKR